MRLSKALLPALVLGVHDEEASVLLKQALEYVNEQGRQEDGLSDRNKQWCAIAVRDRERAMEVFDQEMSEMQVELEDFKAATVELHARINQLQGERNMGLKSLKLTKAMAAERDAGLQKDLVAIQSAIAKVKKGETKELKEALRQFKVKERAVRKSMRHGDSEFQGVIANREQSESMAGEEMRSLLSMLTLRQNLVVEANQLLLRRKEIAEVDSKLFAAVKARCTEFNTFTNSFANARITAVTDLQKVLGQIGEVPVAFLQTEESAEAESEEDMEVDLGAEDDDDDDTAWCKSEKQRMALEKQQLQGSIKQLTSELAGLKSAAASRSAEGTRINEEITRLRQMTDAYNAIAKEESARMPIRAEAFSKTKDLLSQGNVLLQGSQGDLSNKVAEAMTAWDQVSALGEDKVGVAAAFAAAIEARNAYIGEIDITGLDRMKLIQSREKDLDFAQQDLEQLQQSESDLDCTPDAEDASFEAALIKSEQETSDVPSAAASGAEQKANLRVAANKVEQESEGESSKMTPLQRAAAAMGVSFK